MIQRHVSGCATWWMEEEVAAQLCSRLKPDRYRASPADSVLTLRRCVQVCKIVDKRFLSTVFQRSPRAFQLQFVELLKKRVERVLLHSIRDRSKHQKGDERVVTIATSTP